MKLTVRKNLQKGFTLIELLVVIAVLGVLAAVVAVAIDPGEQLARGRDSSRKNSLGQVVNAMQSYYTSMGATYPVTGSWMSTLTTAGELKSYPPAVSYTTAGIICTANASNGYCYYQSGTDAVVYVRLESKAEKNKCVQAGFGSSTLPFFLWNSIDGKAGTFCNSVEPTGVATGTLVTP